MQWHLLNQLYVHLGYEDYHVSLLEEVVSSEQQLAQVLVSGTVSTRTIFSRLCQSHPVETSANPNLEWV